MALKAINEYEYGRLLWKVDNLPYEIAMPLRQELNDTYEKYHQQLSELSETIAAYETVTAKIKSRQILKAAIDMNEHQTIEQV